MNRIYLPFIYFFRHARSFLLQSYLFEGAERETGIELRIAYFGNDAKIRHYWTNRLFGEQVRTLPGSHLFLWRIAGLALTGGQNHDLIIVETNSLTRRFLRFRRGYLLPRWFETLLETRSSIEELKGYGTLNSIKKNGFTCEERSTEEDLRFFYERMFKPYILDRHKDSAVMSDYNYFLKRHRKRDTRLFYLMKDQKPVAGTFVERRDGLIKFSGVGILDGNGEILKMGAIRALYYLMLDYYKSRNVEVVNFGGTSPLLTDGLTKFKLSMSAYPNRHNLLGEKSLWLIPAIDSAPLRALLISNPFIHISRGRIIRALFVETAEIESRKELVKMMRRTAYSRIDGTTIYCWGEMDKISEWIREEHIPDCEIRAFEI